MGDVERMKDKRRISGGGSGGTGTLHIKCVDEDYEHGEFSLQITETDEKED